MGLVFNPSRYRNFYIITRKYCEKSIYQINEEGPKPRTVYGKEYPDWRKPWIQRSGEFTSKLSVFIEKNPSPDILNILSQIPDITVDKMKVWWKDMKVQQEIHNQLYLPERVATLGANLAAIHFFLFRNGAIRLKDSKDWVKGVTNSEFPNTYVDGYFVEAIDCSDMTRNGMRYEGIQNLSSLSFLKWLSLKNNKHIDVWCLDRLAGQNGKTLEYLDISSSDLCVGSVFALARMPALKFLVIKEPGDNIDVQTALSMLEEQNKKLLIKSVTETEVNELK